MPNGKSLIIGYGVSETEVADEVIKLTQGMERHLVVICLFAYYFLVSDISNDTWENLIGEMGIRCLRSEVEGESILWVPLTRLVYPPQLRIFMVFVSLNNLPFFFIYLFETKALDQKPFVLP